MKLSLVGYVEFTLAGSKLFSKKLFLSFRSVYIPVQISLIIKFKYARFFNDQFLSILTI